MKFFTAFILIFVQPVLWFSIIRTFLSSKHRIQNNRDQFRTAIYNQHFEIKNLIKNFILLGVISSIVSLFLGIMLPIGWIIIYEILLLVNLILIPWNIFSFTITILTLIASNLINLGAYINTIQLPFNMNWNISNPSNGLFFITLLLLCMTLFIKWDFGKHNTPKIFRNIRNTRVVGYPSHELSIFPMLILVPGNWIHAMVPFWPILQLNGHSFSIIFLPIVIGAYMTIFKDYPKHLFNILDLRIFKLFIFSLFLSILSYWFSIIVVPSYVAIGLLYWILIFRTFHHNKLADSIYPEVIDGVRIVGIKPFSPAAKMKIEIGDVILDVNDQKVHDENTFYQAILAHPTYCHLRVMDRNHRIKLTGSAIYNNSPHELGIVLFRNDSKH